MLFLRALFTSASIVLSISNLVASLETQAIRDYFYVGGEYLNTPTGHVFTNQMYVEKLTSPHGSTQPYSLIFIHGQAQTGTSWLNKPDGTKGWASFFLDQGYEVYIVDQTARARSSWLPSSNATLTTYSTELIQQRFTAVRDYNLWPQAHLHTQWPGSGKMGDAIFDTYYSANVQFVSNTHIQQTTMQEAGIALLDKLKQPAILIGHSQGGLFPWLWADARPALVTAIISIEPTGPPFREAVFSNRSSRPYGLTDIPLTFYPPVNTSNITPLATRTLPSNKSELVSCVLQVEPVRKLVNLANIPVLLVTGEASYHAPYDHCTVQFLEQAGAAVEHLKLGEIGIHGNGHLPFMEQNSDEIAMVLEEWISATVSKRLGEMEDVSDWTFSDGSEL